MGSFHLRMRCSLKLSVSIEQFSAHMLQNSSDYAAFSHVFCTLSCFCTHGFVLRLFYSIFYGLALYSVAISPLLECLCARSFWFLLFCHPNCFVFMLTYRASSISKMLAHDAYVSIFAALAAFDIMLHFPAAFIFIFVCLRCFCLCCRQRWPLSLLYSVIFYSGSILMFSRHFSFHFLVLIIPVITLWSRALPTLKLGDLHRFRF